MRVRDDLLTKAKEEAARKIEQAQKEIEAEKQQAREEMKKKWWILQLRQQQK